MDVLYLFLLLTLPVCVRCIRTSSEVDVRFGKDNPDCARQTVCGKNEINVNPNDATQESNSCYCDRACTVFDDFCDKAGDRRDIPEWRKQIRKYSTRSPSDFNGFYVPQDRWLVQKCPLDYKAKTIVEFCEKSLPDDLAMREPERIWPVSSTLSGMWYRNIYCSMCWGEQKNIQFWKLNVSCDDTITQRDPIDDRINAGMRTTMLEGVNISTCIKSFVPPSEALRPRDCDNTEMINDCPADWKDQQVAKRCRSYTRTVKIFDPDAGFIWYKNAHCAFCNNALMDRLRCRPKIMLRIFIRIPGYGPEVSFKPLTFLLSPGSDTMDVGRNGEKRSLRCHDGQIFDIFTDNCRNISCGTGFVFVDDRCKSLFRGPQDGCRMALFSEDEYKLFSNQSVFIFNHKKMLNEDEYELKGDVVLVCEDKLIWTEELKENLAFKEQAESIVSTLGLILSIMCLVLLLVVYTILPQLRNSPGKSLMSLAAALAVGQLIFLIGPSARDQFASCVFLAILMHYLFLAVFFWMNTLAIDLFLTFAPKKSLRVQGDPKKRFLKFSLYAWLGPVVFVVVAALLDIAPEKTYPFNPNFGHRHCWFDHRTSLITFFIAPASLLIIANVVMFIFIVYGIRKSYKDTRVVREGSSNKMTLFLYIKLSLLVGLTWTLAFFWLIIGGMLIKWLFIIVNSFQGVLIFIGFVCQPRTLSMLRQRLTGDDKRRQRSNDTVSTRLSSRNSTAAASKRGHTTSDKTGEPPVGGKGKLHNAKDAKSIEETEPLNTRVSNCENGSKSPDIIDTHL